MVAMCCWLSNSQLAYATSYVLDVHGHFSSTSYVARHWSLRCIAENSFSNSEASSEAFELILTGTFDRQKS